MKNPFPGAEPYGPAENARFFGREELSRTIAESILGNRCITVFGPHGAGKTSLLRASVLPSLVESQDARLVHVGAWPAREDPTGRLVDAIHRDLRMGELTIDLGPEGALRSMLKRAVRASSRLVVICLDQLEELLYPDRPAGQTESFLASLEELVDLPLRPVRLVLSLREDHLGPFLEHLRGRLRVLEHYFRVAPFTVAELTDIVCKIAASGDPPQAWSAAELYPLLLEMRVHSQAAVPQAEVRLPYAQSFCHALFTQKAAGNGADERTFERELRPFIEMTVVDLEVPDEPIEAEDHSSHSNPGPVPPERK